ncbi:hypothetical protein AAMO2058_000546500 [Amorphochlora amoebiformis]
MESLISDTEASSSIPIVDRKSLGSLPEGVEGLTDRNAAELLLEFGPNEIDREEDCSDYLQGLCRLVFNPLIALLATLGALSFLTGDHSTGTIITTMALISIGLSGYHQFSAEKAARALSAGFSFDCRVARGLSGKDIIRMASKHLVPGDIVLVSAGDLIPADLQMITSARLLVNQSILTGESAPVLKEANPYYTNDHDSPDNIWRQCCASSRGQFDPPSIELDDSEMCFMGTHVESGSAIGRVIGTGDQTRVGQMAEALKGLRPRSAFDRGVDAFGGLMLKFTLIMAPMVFLIMIIKNGLNTEAFLYAVSVGVGLTPEMLPVVVTVCLALGVRGLNKREKIIVKHLDSLPTFGQLDVLCVDKTGTLTQDAAQVEIAMTVDGDRHTAPLVIGKLHSAHQTGIQNAIEKAVTESTEESMGHSKPSAPILNSDAKLQVVQEWPFDFDRRKASILLTLAEDRQAGQEAMSSIIAVKGACVEVMEICSTYFVPSSSKYAENGKISGKTKSIAHLFDGQALPFTLEAKDRAQTTLEAWGRQGLRAIAVAGRVGDCDILKKNGESDLCLLGFLFLADPPKPSAAAAIDGLQRLGVRVMVLTGDSEEVSRHVCERVGLIRHQGISRINSASAMGSECELKSPVVSAINNSSLRVITGLEISDMDDSKLKSIAAKHTIFARLQPMHKQRIVKALQDSGLAVGFLGDGVNDCAALRCADVGISVNTGLDVAKAAADVVLIEKSLTSLERCVWAGRQVCSNVLKYIKMAASSNWGNMFSVLSAALFLPFVPMLPLQVVAGNLLYDFAQLAIPSDNVPSWHLTQPIRWKISAIARFVLLLGPVSSLFDLATFLVAYWALGGRDDPRVFRTSWFIEGILSQLMIVFVLRSAIPETAPGFPPLRKPDPPEKSKSRHICNFLCKDGGPSVLLTLVTVGMGILVILCTQIDAIAQEFEFVDLPKIYWPWLVAILLSYALLTTLLMKTVLPRLLLEQRSCATKENADRRPVQVFIDRKMN